MPYQLNDKGKQVRGFAAMSPEEVRRVATLGGKASHGGGRKPYKHLEGKTDGNAR
jgi:hypothetical protein